MSKVKIQSLEEIKKVLKKFKKAGGVGFVLAPKIIQIAQQVGLAGYSDAMARFLRGSIYSEQVITDVPIDATDATDATDGNGLLISWEGPSLRYISTNLCIGLERTLEEIELCL
jgi:hypothetical protein